MTKKRIIKMYQIAKKIKKKSISTGKKIDAILRQKIFCISLQRTGTTSVGEFFRRNGYRVANYSTQKKNDWTKLWFNGEIEKIFKSPDFRTHQVFEDNPWWCGSFYKKLYHKFENAKFVLFERDPDDWFDSMLSHSDGKTLGNTYRHSVLYERNYEFYRKFEGPVNAYTEKIDNLMSLEGKRNHYKKVYTARNKRVKDFFSQNDKERLFASRLDDKDKWKKMGNFFGIDIPENYEVHVNEYKG